MAALRWFLFSILAFGGGAAGAFLANPPELGIPAATASTLRGHLSEIQRLAAAGQCDQLRTELRQSQNAVDSASSKVSATVETQLRNAFDQVDRRARTTCSDVLDAKNPSVTPAPKPEVPAEPEPTTPSDGGDEAGGPDPGTGEGTTPSGGDGTDGGTTPSGGGGTTLNSNSFGGRVRDRLDDLRDEVTR